MESSLGTILTSPFIIRTLASHHPQGSWSLALEKIWQEIETKTLRHRRQKWIQIETRQGEQRSVCAVGAPHLNFLALPNVLLSISGWWQPDIAEGCLALWLPTEKKRAVSHLARTPAFHFKSWTILYDNSLSAKKKNRLTCSQRQWWESHCGCPWQSPAGQTDK